MLLPVLIIVQTQAYSQPSAIPKCPIDLLTSSQVFLVVIRRSRRQGLEAVVLKRCLRLLFGVERGNVC